MADLEGEIVLVTDEAADNNRGGRRKYVAKKYHLEEVTKSAAFKQLIENIATEVHSMLQFRHPNLVPCLSATVNGSDLLLTMPWMKYGSVRDLIDTHYTEGLPEVAVAFILRDVLAGLEYLHSKVTNWRLKRDETIFSFCFAFSLP